MYSLDCTSERQYRPGWKRTQTKLEETQTGLNACIASIQESGQLPLVESNGGPQHCFVSVQRMCYFCVLSRWALGHGFRRVQGNISATRKNNNAILVIITSVWSDGKSKPASTYFEYVGTFSGSCRPSGGFVVVCSSL